METVLGNLLPALRSRGDSIILSMPQGPAADYLARFADEWLPYSPPTALGQFDARDRIQAVSPDLLVAVHHNLSLIISAAALGIPSVTMLGGVRCHYGALEEEYRLSLAICEHVIVPSEFARKDLDCFPLHHKVKSISNGVDTDRFAPPSLTEKEQVRALLGIPREAFLLGYSARLTQQKRHELLLPVLAGLVQAGIPAHLLLVGRGDATDSWDTWQKLQAAADKLSLHHHLHFIGSQPTEVAHWLKPLDVFIFPPEKEGLGCALLEAMSVGLPVVVEGDGGAKEPLRYGPCGYVVDSSQTEDLVAKLSEWYAHPQKRVGCGTVAREIVKKYYSVEAMAVEYFQTFHATRLGSSHSQT